MTSLPAKINMGHNSKTEIKLPVIVPDFVYKFLIIRLRES